MDEVQCAFPTGKTVEFYFVVLASSESEHHGEISMKLQGA